MAKRAVLFVDDDPDILAGLKARLYPQRAQWQMAFASSGAEALELLRERHVDVIVTDMRMPEMDGAALLRQVQQTHPQVVRIVLSGQADQDTAIRAVPVAHQYLSKPCEPGQLEDVVNRACDLRELIGDDQVSTIVGRVESLPPFPRLYAELVTTLANQDATAADVARILGQDMAMCAKLLQMVNSAFFRLSRAITKVEQAVVYLGFGTIKQLVLTAEVFACPRPSSKLALLLEQMQEHALWVARLATAVTTDESHREDAFMAGLLHDIGKLVLAVELPEVLEEVTAASATGECSLIEAERAVYGATHAQIGGYLLGLWGLPLSVVEAVANHHEPSRVDAAQCDILATTHIANALVHAASATDESPGSQPWTALDLDFVERRGYTPHLSRWFDLAVSLGPEPACGEEPESPQQGAQ